MVSDGSRILTASTAAGPAFEGVNISCGSRAVDGAITKVKLIEGKMELTTIADAPPAGLTGSGLLSAIAECRQIGIIDEGGRIFPPKAGYTGLVEPDNSVYRIVISKEESIYISQMDVRELQKAKGAIRAAVDILLDQLGLQPGDLEQVILTGSFGGEVDIDAILDLGLLPPVRKQVVETIANGAGFGAAMFLSEDGFAHGEKLAKRAAQVDLDQNANFYDYYIAGMKLAP